MTIEEKEQEIIDEFSIFDDWMDKYAYLIELGSGLEGMDEAHKTEENLIKGCQSRVWFHADMQDGLLYFQDISYMVLQESECCTVRRIC